MEETPTQEIPRDTFGEATAVEQSDPIREKFDRGEDIFEHVDVDAARVVEPTVTSTTDSPPQPEAEPTSNVVEATEACRQAEPELAGMPPQQDEAKLAFTPDQLDAAGVVYNESVDTRYIEINGKAQALLIAASNGAAPNDILQAVLAAYGIEGEAKFHTHPVTQTLSIWQGKGPAAQEAAPAGPSSSHLTTEQLLALHQQTCDAARGIMRAKNNDYTDGSVDCFANFRTAETVGVKAETGVLIRVLDKIKRIQTFVNKGTLQVQGESVDDAIQDIINYCVLLKGIIVERRVA